MDDKNYFAELYAVNVNDHTERKNGLTYLSWAWAWAEVKKLHADATYTIYEDANGRIYHTDGRTAWVKTGVTVNGLEHIEYLPIMDVRNRSIPLANVTSMDANKAIQRSLTKACARHGLGLYIYAGEDLPEEETQAAAPDRTQEAPAKPARKAKPKPSSCSVCGKPIVDTEYNGQPYTAEQIVEISTKKRGVVMCIDCAINGGNNA